MKLLIRFGLSFVLITQASHAGHPDYAVDQRHDLVDVDITSHNVQLAGPMVQEFVPQTKALNLVELWTDDFGTPRSNGLGATLQVVIRADTTNGTVLATSEPVRLQDDHSGVTRFEFAPAVQLQMGVRYALELQVLGGDFWGVRSYGRAFPQYLPGRYFRGAKTDDLDMWFRTGLKHSPLEIRMTAPGTIEWQGDASLTYRVWASSDLVTWTDLGSVSSEDTRFVFHIYPETADQRFFRVGLP